MPKDPRQYARISVDLPANRKLAGADPRAKWLDVERAVRVHPTGLHGMDRLATARRTDRRPHRERDRSMTPSPACLGASPIAPDDERHGTLTGYTRGCREACCRRARMRHEKRRRMDRDKGILYTVPAVGTIRRIHALMAIGWTSKHIAELCGWQEQAVQLLCRRAQVNRRTAEKIAAAYEQLCMKPGPSKITRKRAARSGWLPPLAYDDIDDPDERPVLRLERRHHADIDPVVVERVLAGEKLPTTRAEKDEVLRQWKAKGGSERALCARQGWKAARYDRQEAS